MVPGRNPAGSQAATPTICCARVHANAQSLVVHAGSTLLRPAIFGVFLLELLTSTTLALDNGEFAAEST